MEEKLSSILPKAALDDIPTPKNDAVSITGLVKQKGKITGYQLSDDRIVSREDGVALAKAGEIKGVGIAHRKDTEYQFKNSPIISTILLQLSLSLCLKYISL